MRLQGDGHVLIAQAYVGFQLLGYLRYFFSDLLLEGISDMDDDDAR